MLMLSTVSSVMFYLISSLTGVVHGSNVSYAEFTGTVAGVNKTTINHHNIKQNFNNVIFHRDNKENVWVTTKLPIDITTFSTKVYVFQEQYESLNKIRNLMKLKRLRMLSAGRRFNMNEEMPPYVDETTTTSEPPKKLIDPGPMDPRQIPFPDYGPPPSLREAVPDTDINRPEYWYFGKATPGIGGYLRGNYLVTVDYPRAVTPRQAKIPKTFRKKFEHTTRRLEGNAEEIETSTLEFAILGFDNLTDIGAGKAFMPDPLTGDLEGEENASYEPHKNGTIVDEYIDEEISGHPISKRK